MLLTFGRSFVRFGEGRARNEIRLIATFQVGVAEFEVAQAGSADANKGWSVGSVSSGRATLEAGIDSWEGFEGGDGQHGARPPPAFADSDDPDPDESAWSKLADLMNFH
jgi:hypothetical protein